MIDDKAAKKTVLDAIMTEAKRRKLKVALAKTHGEHSVILGGANVTVNWGSYTGRRSITVAASGYGTGARARSFPWRPDEVAKAVAKAPKIVQALVEVADQLAALAEAKDSGERALMSAAADGVKALRDGGVEAYHDRSPSGGYRGPEVVYVYLGSPKARDTSGISITARDPGHLDIVLTTRIRAALNNAPAVVKAIKLAIEQIQQVAEVRGDDEPEDDDGPE